eukprot:TRINITY_DN45876_c0_g1_i1.p2 TRINITY_DN45876_c0_g1~~TRINITY_DN45876_c0_g1_i1.p2  ORF type:complete len:143 (-),score=34.13 TRINITY_DN45876_c0_g1_i1:82-510(-)
MVGSRHVALLLLVLPIARAAPVQIVAPKGEKSASMKASEAIADYHAASAAHMKAWDAAARAITAAPATYATHLAKVGAAQEEAIKALDNAITHQEDAASAASSAVSDAEALYGSKQDALQSSRAGDDFVAEAEALKAHMTTP